MLITFFQAIAQPYPQKLWDKRYGGYGWDQAFTTPIKKSLDGNLLFLAESSGGPNGDLGSAAWGSFDYWLFKTDTLGNLLWEKGVGGFAWDIARDFVELDDGGFLLVGYTLSGQGGDKTESSRGNRDIWIVRLDSTRNILWDKTYGGNKADACWSVCKTPEGGFILAGYTKSDQGLDVSDPKFTPPNWPEDDFWVLKLDSLGNKIWDKRYGWDQDDLAFSVNLMQDGNYLITGYTYSDMGGSITQQRKGSTDYWALKIDTAGNKLWDQRYGSNNYDWDNYSTKITPDGGFIIGGVSMGDLSYDKTEMNRGGEDYWIVKCDSMGNKQWDKTLGGSFEEGLRDILITGDGSFIISGFSKSQDTGDKTQANWPGSANCAWLVKLRANGTKAWDVRWSGNRGEDASSTLELGNGTFVTLAITTSNASFDKSQNNWSATPTTTPNADLWLLAFTEPPLGYENLGDTKGGLDVFPNPFRETLEVGAEFREPGKVFVEIFDITGRKVFENNYTISTSFFNKEIELGFLPAGAYSLSVTTGSEKRTRLVVKR